MVYQPHGTKILQIDENTAVVLTSIEINAEGESEFFTLLEHNSQTSELEHPIL